MHSSRFGGIVILAALVALEGCSGTASSPPTPSQQAPQAAATQTSAAAQATTADRPAPAGSTAARPSRTERTGREAITLAAGGQWPNAYQMNASADRAGPGGAARFPAITGSSDRTAARTSLPGFPAPLSPPAGAALSPPAGAADRPAAVFDLPIRGADRPARPQVSLTAVAGNDPAGSQGLAAVAPAPRRAGAVEPALRTGNRRRHGGPAEQSAPRQLE